MEETVEEILSEADLRREQLIRGRNAFLAACMKDPEFVEIMGAFASDKQKSPIQLEKPKAQVISRKRKRRASDDETFRCAAQVPIESRRSLRLQDKKPLFTADDLIEEKTARQLFNSDEFYDYEDIENVVYKPKGYRPSMKRDVEPVTKSVEDITESMLNNIARKVSAKKYSDMGTTCHQCRQKTADQKTYCRNVDCSGRRGMFCGVCLLNRYGEDVAKALLDPNWHCPVCRGICNCSFCRARAGKRPTGILTPLAQKHGHKCVKDFLISLRGEGDYVEDDMAPNNLLGFTGQNLMVARMGGGVEYIIQPHIGTDRIVEKMNYLKTKLDNINTECNENDF